MWIRKRGQVQFPGTARRVLRRNWTCPFFPQPADGKAASLAELVELCRRRNLPLIYDLGDGGLMGLPDVNLPGQPTATESVRAAPTSC